MAFSGTLPIIPYYAKFMFRRNIRRVSDRYAQSKRFDRVFKQNNWETYIYIHTSEGWYTSIHGAAAA